MAYDDDELANRIRGAVQGERGLTEKPMFGGLAFLIHRNIAVSASEWRVGFGSTPRRSRPTTSFGAG
jgi:hypothetical protein